MCEKESRKFQTPSILNAVVPRGPIPPPQPSTLSRVEVTSSSKRAEVTVTVSHPHLCADGDEGAADRKKAGHGQALVALAWIYSKRGVGSQAASALAMSVIII